MDADTLLATLMSMGFDFFLSKKAIDAGFTTVESATDWMLRNVGSGSNGDGVMGSAATPTLSLRQGEAFTTASMDSTPIHSRETSPARVGDDASVFPAGTSQSAESTPTIESRYKTSRKTYADMATSRALEDAKRLKRLQQDSKAQILRQIQEDRETVKERRGGGGGGRQAGTESNASGSASTAPPQQPSPPRAATIQIRLPSNFILKNSFSPSSSVATLFDFVRANAPAQDAQVITTVFMLLVPFPRRVFDETVDGALTLRDAGLYPSASLNVMKPSVSSPTPATGSAVPMGVDDRAAVLESREESESEASEEEDDEDEEDSDEDDNHRAAPAAWGTGHRLTDPNINTNTGPNTNSQPPIHHASPSALRRLLPAQSSPPKPTSSPHKRKPVPTLKSLCLIAATRLLCSAKTPPSYLHPLRNLPPSVTELLIAHLRTTSHLTRPTLQKLSICPISSLVLNHYALVTDSMLNVIGERFWNCLTVLSLRGCEMITDKGVGYLKGLRWLEELDLGGCRLTDGVAEYLGDLKSLTTLSLSGTKFTAAGLQHLTETPLSNSLTTLSLSSCNHLTTPNLFALLSRFSALQTLHLASTPITSSSNPNPVLVPPPPNSFPVLYTLDISNTSINHADFENVICGMKELRELDIRGCWNLEGLECVSRELRSLEWVGFPQTLITRPEVLEGFCDLPLHTLDLSNNNLLTPKHFEAITKLGPTLQTLNIPHTPLPPPSSTYFLAHLTSLTHLDASHTPFTDTHTNFLTPLALQNLSLAHTPITSQTLTILTQPNSLPRQTLQVLNVGYCRNVRDEGLECLGRMAGMRGVCLDWTGCSLEGVEELRGRGFEVRAMGLRGRGDEAVEADNGAEEEE